MALAQQTVFMFELSTYIIVPVTIILTFPNK